ncbi:MAG TPA: hypothetical protein VGM82_23370 [Gemmatimonadaceae bacterium]|jgi:hypothetical protein
MSIRALALDWLAPRHRVGKGRILTSKYYEPAESWTGADAWWVQIPLVALDQDPFVHIVVQSAPGSTEFRYLRVPTTYLRQHVNGLATLKETHLSLFLDAGPRTFIDRRGSTGVPFAQFEITTEHPDEG